MKLLAPNKAPALDLVDVFGKPIPMTEDGKVTLLSFFRDAACPFCNLRIYQLTQNYEHLNRLGLRVVAIFPDGIDEVRQYVVRNGRPFPIIANARTDAHELYGIESSIWGKFRAALLRLPTLMRARKILGKMHRSKTNNLMPADFLLNDKGEIITAHYGKDFGDRIPFEMIEDVLAKNVIRRAYEGKPLTA